MSTIEFIKLKDKNITLQTDTPVYGIPIGPSFSNVTRYVAQGLNNNSLNFSITTVDKSVLISRKIRLNIDFEMQFQGLGVPGGGLLQIGTYDAVRSYGIHRNIQNINLSIDGTSTSVNIADLITILSHIQSDFNNDISITKPDNGQYEDYTNSVNSVLGRDYEKNQRGAQMCYEIINNNQNDALIRVHLSEYLLISPLQWHGIEKSGFHDINKLDITIQFINNLNRLWSHAINSPNVINSIVTNIINASIDIKYMTVDENLISVPIPSIEKPIYNSYNKMSSYIQAYTAGPVAPNAQFTFNSQNYDFGALPTKLIIFFEENDNMKLFSDSNTFLSIESIDMKIGNKSGLLSNYSAQDLFEITKKNINNENYKYSDFVGYNFITNGNTTTKLSRVGSFLVLDIARDIYNDISHPVGSIAGGISISCRIVVRNNTQRVFNNVIMKLITIEDGYMVTTSPYKHTFNLSVVRPDILKDKTIKEIDDSSDNVLNVGGSLFGGNFWETLKNVPMDIFNLIKNIMTDPFTKGITDQGVINYAKKAIGLGLIEGKGMQGHGLIEGKGGEIEGYGKKKGKENKGKENKGGKQMTDKQIKDMIAKLKNL